LLPPFAVVIHNGLLAYVVATSAWIVIYTGMPIQLLPPFAVVIHNSLLAYVVAIPAAVVICIGFRLTGLDRGTGTGPDRTDL
jgi:hypothetical protein